MLLSAIVFSLNMGFSINLNSNSDILLSADVINSPGLTCRPISLAMVYGGPSLSSKVLGRTQNYIAITGSLLNGFFPIITGSGVKGWVRERDTWTLDSVTEKPCKVQMLPNGHLIFY